MSFITGLTRSWLTRSWKSFHFTNEYDEKLSFEECERLGLYIHIPFCRSICNFCPYCKTIYTREKCDAYVDSLLEEIRMAGSQLTAKKQVSSLYFGGGSPALAANRLKEIIQTVEKYFVITNSIGIELHPNDVTQPILKLLKEAGVTKISIGVQSFSKNFQQLLGRPPVDAELLVKELQTVKFETVSIDFIFALPGQTFEDLKEDVDTAFSHGANHVAVYPFIDFTFTKSPVKAMPKKEKHQLLDQITEYCAENGYERGSIWTFSKESGAEYSSMTRENFLGFGCSATTLLKKQFKVNTFSVEEYCKRVQNHQPATCLTLRFTLRQRMVYWLFWTAYSTKVDHRDFERFFGVPLEKMYGAELKLAKMLGFVTEQNGIYQMTARGAFYYHYYENFYTLAYIDKMWGILREEAFPKELTL